MAEELEDNPFWKTRDATETYILENQYVNSLERRIIGKRSGLQSDSRLLAAAWRLGRTVKSILTYLTALVKYRRWFASLLALKGGKRERKALVIGNGPSQGYMKIAFLEAFRRTGGEIFVVNFWNQNESLATFVPDYLVISDPATLRFGNGLEALHSQNASLLQYLTAHQSIKVICPFPRCSEVANILGPGRAIGFVDTELRGLIGNINPLYPRGYLTMTLYKALAMALFFGYKDIYVIGMDNTYPRNIYCDGNNRILNLEKHSGVADWVVDQSNAYPCVGDLLKELAVLFFDAKKFAVRGAVKNLDRYSLTDAFPKAGFTDAIGGALEDVDQMIHGRLARELKKADESARAV